MQQRGIGVEGPPFSVKVVMPAQPIRSVVKALFHRQTLCVGSSGAFHTEARRPMQPLPCGHEPVWGLFMRKEGLVTPLSRPAAVDDDDCVGSVAFVRRMAFWKWAQLEIVSMSHSLACVVCPRPYSRSHSA